MLENLAKHPGKPEHAAVLDRIVEHLYSNAEQLDSGEARLQKLEASQLPTIKSTHMTWAETLRQEGRQEERQAILIRLLERKFGSLPEEALARLESASTEELEEISYLLLEAASLDEVFLPMVREGRLRV